MDPQPQKVSILQKLLGKVAPGQPAPASVAPASSATSAAIPAGGVAATPVASPVGKPVAGGPAPASAPATSAAIPPNTAPPATPAPVSGAPASGNAFTKLFGVSTGMSTSAPGNGLASKVPSIASLLGPKPTFSRHEYEAQEEHATNIAKRFFQFAIVLTLGIYGFFYVQLEPDFTLLSSQFGPNVAAQFERSNTEIENSQTELNLIRFRLARLLLDEVNSQIDARAAQKNSVASLTTTDLQKKNARDTLVKVNADIKQNLVEIQKIFSQPLGVDTFSREPITVSEREAHYLQLLQEGLQKQRAALSSDAKPNRDELKLIDNVARLVDNTAFQGILRAKDFGAVSDTDLDGVLTQIREEGTDQLSSIEKIRKQRINWAKIISDVNEVTRKADLYYGQGLFKTVGGFLFSTYRFDAKTKRIGITGVTKTSDSKTFSFIAKLVDSIEKSPRFKDIDFRSFVKTRDEGGDYSSSINLDFALQGNTEMDPRDDLTSTTHSNP